MVKNKRNIFQSDNIFLSVVYAFLFIAIMIMVYPFIITISTSISDNRALVAAGTVYFLPEGFSLKAYDLLLHTPVLPRYYGNTVFYAVTGTILMLFISITAAYPLSVKVLPGKKVIMLLFTVTLFISGGLIPYYLWLKAIGLNNNIWVMIVPGALNVWNMIIFKAFFQQLPQDISESAFMDGANDIKILTALVIPLSKPIIATFAIFGLVAVWNDFFTSLVFLKDPDLQPMQLYLKSVVVQMDTNLMRSGINLGGFSDFIDGRTVRAAIIVITVLPIACVYPFFQKYFAKGILIGSIKG